MRRTMVPARARLLGSALVWALMGCSQAGGSGPRPEVAETTVELKLPAPPDFKEPEAYPDGSHSVTEMRLRGQQFLEQKVKVTGYVVYKYDLATCAREAGERHVEENPKLCAGKGDVIDCTLKVGQRIVDESPDQCERPYFYLADTANASSEKSIWVVDVPRPLRADERRDPGLVEAFKKGPQPPDIKIGDKVAVEGTWAVKSPSGFGKSDGLLIYASLTPAN